MYTATIYQFFMYIAIMGFNNGCFFDPCKVDNDCGICQDMVSSRLVQYKCIGLCVPPGYMMSFSNGISFNGILTEDFYEMVSKLNVFKILSKIDKRIKELEKEANRDNDEKIKTLKNYYKKITDRFMIN